MSVVVDGFFIAESASPIFVDEGSTKKRKRGRPRKNPSPLPKPPNPFILYSLETRAKLAGENKDLSNTEISRMLGTSWRRLHPDEKKKYKKQAAEMREQQEQSNNNEDSGDDNKNNTNTNSIEHLAPLYMALYEANIGLNSLVGADHQPRE